MLAEQWQVVIIEKKLHSRSGRRWSCKTRQASGTPNRIVRCLAQQLNEKLFPSLLSSNPIRPILPKYNNNFFRIRQQASSSHAIEVGIKQHSASPEVRSWWTQTRGERTS